MVLEALIGPIKAERRPWLVFFIGFLYASLSMFLSLWVFREYSSLIMVFLTVMFSIPLVYSTLKNEERKDIMIEEESTLLKEHGKALTFLMTLFLGFVAAFSFWYVVLPNSWTNSLFFTQTQTIANINSAISGHGVHQFNTLTKIFLNNIKVLVFCLLFAFIYGLGAIFILTWNASVIATAIGNFIRTEISKQAANLGATGIGTYFQAVSLGLLRYFIHGIPEMAAYFVGGLAGGIISIAVIRKDYKTRKFEKIVFDSSELIIIAIFLLVLAAFLEVFITPMFFR